VPVTLRSGAESIGILSYIDTGASNCLFQRGHGRMLNLDIEAGEPVTFQAATGGVKAFGHMVSLEVLGLSSNPWCTFLRTTESGKTCSDGPAGWTGFVLV
jgi:hypothetical protein